MEKAAKIRAHLNKRKRKHNSHYQILNVIELEYFSVTMQKKSLVLYKNSKSDKLHLEVFGEVNAMVVPEVKTNEAHSRITIDKSNHCYMSVLESHYKKDLAEIFTLRPAVIQLMDEIWDKLRWVPQFCVISRYGDRPLIGQIMQVVTSLPYRLTSGAGRPFFTLM